MAHDDAPYPSATGEDAYGHLKKAGMFKATQRTQGISTSDVILRIIKEYDMYVARLRDRGFKSSEIGISQSKMMKMEMKSKFQ